MKNNIVIIGMGNMGRRHLQAVSKLGYLESIVCFDHAASSLEMSRKFCMDNGIDVSKILFVVDEDKAIEMISSNTIVILAATAKGRKDTLLNIIAKGPKAVIAEKPVCQNINEYDAILSLSMKSGCKIYLNFSRHAYPCYMKIKNELDPSALSYMSSFYSGGIACIGIHMLELATWLFDAGFYKIISSNLTKPWETKRKGFFDFSGDFTVLFDGKTICHLNDRDENSLFEINLRDSNTSYALFEAQKKMITVSAKEGPTIEDIDIPYTSQTTDKVADDIFSGKKPCLPDAKSSYLSHKILFELMDRSDLNGLNIT